MTAPRIDAHQHYWRYDPAEYDWIDDTMAPLRRDFLPPDAIGEMRSAGFDVLRSRCRRVRRLAETKWLLGLADRYPFIAGVVGWVDLRSADLDAQLEAVAGHPRLVGVRHVVQAEPDDFLARPEVRRGIGRLEHFGLAYDILVYARQLPRAIECAAALPSARLVLDHLGKPDVGSGAFAEWRSDLNRLAEQPNVFAKLSGLVTEADWRGWTPVSLRPYVDAAFDAFGADRLMIGSDWPVCTVAGTYARCDECRGRGARGENGWRA